jgi:hypothetical protein
MNKLLCIVQLEPETARAIELAKEQPSILVSADSSPSIWSQ